MTYIQGCNYSEFSLYYSYLSVMNNAAMDTFGHMCKRGIARLKGCHCLTLQVCVVNLFLI